MVWALEEIALARRYKQGQIMVYGQIHLLKLLWEGYM